MRTRRNAYNILLNQSVKSFNYFVKAAKYVSYSEHNTSSERIRHDFMATLTKSAKHIKQTDVVSHRHVPITTVHCDHTS